MGKKLLNSQKDLLLKDLCARLPYGVVIQEKCVEQDKTFLPNKEGDRLVNIDAHAELLMTNCGSWYYLDEVKPYLFPLSSMTEEQKYDFYCRFIENDCNFDDFKKFYLENNEWHKMLTSIDDIEEIIDWFNKNHFDFRCLIPIGLANDATGLNIY